MEKKTVLKISAIVLVALGILMIVLGLAGAKIVLPPIVTGLGFFVIAWVLHALRE